MARNEEKHYGRLNRLFLQKEKEEYEKNHPKRPRLDYLETVEEIQHWLPSIKQDLNFYLKKSLVICYSDAHIEECKLKVTKLEKEYKAFVRKIAQLTPGNLEAVPWTSRSYKRKSTDPVEAAPSKKEFKPIPLPILAKETSVIEACHPIIDIPHMDEPLSFVSSKKQNSKESHSNLFPENKELNKSLKTFSSSESKTSHKKQNPYISAIHVVEKTDVNYSNSPCLVNYDVSSDSDS